MKLTLFCVLYIMAELILIAPSWAAPSASYQADSGLITIAGAARTNAYWLANNPANIYLQAIENSALGSMAFEATVSEKYLLVKPLYPLLPNDYVLRLTLPTGELVTIPLHIAQPEAELTAPKLTHISPSTATLPANALRIYLYFDQSIARGQVSRFIHLYDMHGIRDDHAFLNTAVELWDQSQTRLTLLLDPGRVKQDVGPNKQLGAPLVEGRSMQIRIAKGLKSAKGVPTATEQQIDFAVTAAQRSKLDPEDWSLTIPDSNSMTPVSIDFGRVMDAENVRRNILILRADGSRVHGSTEYDKQWHFFPSTSWQPGKYHLVIHQSLEDIAGNRLNTAFDTIGGTQQVDPTVRYHSFEITP